MVKQTIEFSDGSETVIEYRGKIVDGVLLPDNVENMSDETEVEGAEVAEEAAPEEVSEETTEETVEEAVEAPETTEEVVEESTESEG